MVGVSESWVNPVLFILWGVICYYIGFNDGKLEKKNYFIGFKPGPPRERPFGSPPPPPPIPEKGNNR